MGKLAKLSSTIALDSKNDKVFKRDVKKIKKNILRNHPGPKDAYLERGLIYLNHIPPGFYEIQIRKYFSQFGAVTNVRVLRSKRNAKCKGAAFVEFKEPEVAKIAAETMDNYLMFKRRLECTYVEPEKRSRHLFRYNFTLSKCPSQKNRVIHSTLKNKSVSPEDHAKAVKRSLLKLKKKNALSFCQITHLDVTLDDVEVNPLNKKEEVKTVAKKAKQSKRKQEETKEVSAVPVVKKSKEVSAKEEQPEEACSDDSIVIAPELLKPQKSKVKSAQTPKEDNENGMKVEKKSLITIQKRKDKKKKASTELLEEMVSEFAVPEKKGKAQLMLDPSLVTQANFTEKKSKKTGVKAKKIRKST